MSGIRDEMTIQKQNVAIKSLQAFLYTILQRPVVRRPIRANPVLNFNPGLLISLFKSFRLKFPHSFLGHSMIKLQAKIFELSFLLKPSELQSNFTLTLVYLNPALNNPGQGSQ